jgi:hypothetical protein
MNDVGGEHCARLRRSSRFDPTVLPGVVMRAWYHIILEAFFPADAALIESFLDAQESTAPWPGAKHANFAAGEAIGRAVGAEVMAWTQATGSDAPSS